MAKTYIKTLRQLMMVASSTNFSDMELPDGEPFDAGDNGEATDMMYSQVQADAQLLSLLHSMNDREKIVLMYQILRESGFNLNHEDCAKTLNISRKTYMLALKGVKKRAAKILNAFI
jgi:DNA-directed RNA polymerase specialized sigma24 family protein